MARNLRKATASTGVSRPPNIVSEDGKLTEQAVRVINIVLDNFWNIINGRISFGDGAQSSWTGNLNGQYREVTTPGSANVEFTLDHGLDRVPVGIIVVNRDKACIVYSSRPKGWNKDSIYLKCDTATSLVKLFIF